MKISHNDKNKKPIKAAVGITSDDELADLIKEVLDSDMCEEIVNSALSDYGYFDQEWFEDIDTLCDAYFSNSDPLEVARHFYNGKDLDDDEDHANPDRDYARLDWSGDVETTDYPGDIYYNDILDDIVDFIVEHKDDGNFPDEVQELIDSYIDEDSEDDLDEDEEDEEDSGEEE